MTALEVSLWYKTAETKKSSLDIRMPINPEFQMTQLDSSEQNIETTTPGKSVPFSPGLSPWLPRIVYPLGRYVVMPFYFGRMEVSGQEHIPKTGPVILAPTHRSRWDAFVVPYAAGRLVTGRDLRPMVSANEMKGPQGWVIRRMGGFPVDTEQPGIGSFRYGVELLHKGEMVVIFPEGGIYQDNRVHPLKRGLARIALQVESSSPGLGVKILPISIIYSERVPHWRCDFTVNIGSPLNVADYCNVSPRLGSQKLTADLEATLKQLDGERAIAPSPIQSSTSLENVPSAQL
nr:1-acyl-sn-glycerol-3-phosphate acyltransferase [Microcoleus sp. FACHB-831]